MERLPNSDHWVSKNRSSWISLKINVDNTKPVSLVITGSITCRPVENKSVNQMRIVVNDAVLMQRQFNLDEKGGLQIDILPRNLKGSDNTIVIYYDFISFNHEFYLYKIELEYFPFEDSRYDWMSRITDDLLLCDVNIPGSHDAASVRKSNIHSLYSCQDRSVKDQLLGGIRVFDIRIKVKDFSKNGFVTCHGNLGVFGSNEYEPLKAVFDAFTSFLGQHPSEVVIASVKIDDWGVGKDEHNRALPYLRSFLADYKTCKVSSMPKVKDVRGFIYLLNRIDNTFDYGVPLNINEAYEGAYLSDVSGRSFKIYVQDKWNIKSASPTSTKLDLVWKAILKKEDQFGELNFSFASVNYYLMGIYIMDKLLANFGKTSKEEGRPSKLGWILFDYGFNKINTEQYGYIDIIEFIIDSNFGYPKYPSRFEVSG